jgi:hypothetical protein
MGRKTKAPGACSGIGAAQPGGVGGPLLAGDGCVVVQQAQPAAQQQLVLENPVAQARVRQPGFAFEFLAFRAGVVAMRGQGQGHGRGEDEQGREPDLPERQRPP